MLVFFRYILFEAVPGILFYPIEIAYEARIVMDAKGSAASWASGLFGLGLEELFHPELFDHLVIFYETRLIFYSVLGIKVF
jgi:hypothetical protein